MANSRRLGARFAMLVAASAIVFQTLSPNLSAVSAADPSASPPPSASPASPPPDSGSSSAPASPDPSSPANAGPSLPLDAPTGSTIVPYQAADYRYQIVATGTGAGFEATSFDDSSWTSGTAAFGSGGACALESTVATSWNIYTDVLVRRHVELPLGTSGLNVSVAIDNDAQVFWNGTLIGSSTHEFCPSLDNFTFQVADNLLVGGDNVLAVRGADHGDQTLLDITVRGSLPAGGVLPEDVPPGMENQEHNGTSNDPVGTFSGDFHYSFTDVAIAGRGPSPTFTRSYNSADTRIGRLGPGWTDDYATRLRSPDDGSSDVFFVGADGNTDRYVHNPDDTFSPPAAVYRTLIYNPDGTYVATELNQSGWSFDGLGNLTAITDRYGNTSNLGYGAQGRLTSISDPAGRGSLALAYTNGLLTTITDWASQPRTVTYQYDANGRLWKVTDRTFQTTTFGYDGTSQRLTTITDALGHVAVTMTYDGQGRVQTQQDAQGLVTGATTTFAYVVNPDMTRVTTVTYPPASFEPSFSPTVVDSYNAVGWMTSRVSRPTSTEILTESNSYDATGNRTAVTDPRGYTTDYCYDVSYAGAAITGSRGNLTRRIDPAPTAGANRPATLYAYDAHNNPTQTVAPKGVPSGVSVTCSTNLSAINASYATDLGYDPTATMLLSTTTRYTDPNTGAQTATTKLEYDDSANPGLVTRIIPPRGNTGPNPDYTYATTFSYAASGSQAGMLASTIDPLGNTVTMVYDAVGRTTMVVDPLGNTAGGVPAEHNTQFTYDGEDRVHYVSLPAPVPLQGSLRTETLYDAVGNPTVQIDANGQKTTFAYDERDGLFQVKESPLTWTLTSPTPTIVLTTEYSYDAAGHLARMTRAKGDAATERVTDYLFDGRGLVRRETQYPSWPSTSPTLVTTSAYDPNGNLATLLDPLGRTTTSSYDRLNRLTGVDYSDTATPDVAFGFDANGNRTSMTDGTGATGYVYDEANRLTSVTSPGPKTVGYRYDLDGNRTKLIYPDAMAVTYTFNKASQLVSLLDWASRSVSYTYWPDGALKTATKPDASVATYGYDNARRLTDILDQQASTTIGQYAYVLDSVGNVTAVSDGDASVTRSVSSAATLANGASSTPSISADGRYAAFSSTASNLVPGDTNAVADVFVHDLQTGTTSRVSVATSGAQATGASSSPSISADGRYIGFSSTATNLVSGDTNAASDVFRRDLQTGTTIRASVGSGGAQATGASSSASISADGRYIAFSSTATNLVSGDTNAVSDVFRRDLQSGTTIRASVAFGGVQATGASSSPSINANGAAVAFVSDASNLVSGDTNAASDIFYRDVGTGSMIRVSVAADGSQATGPSSSPSISGGGLYVAFNSTASNLVPGDTNAVSDVFVRSFGYFTTSRVSVTSAGTEATGASSSPSLSADGRYVAFSSTASDLASGDTNAAADVFRHDLQTGSTSRVSVATGGGQATGGSSGPSISSDGSLVSFASDANNLASGDTNGVSDVFVRFLQNTYSYDRLYRLTSAKGPDGARTYTYDLAGNRASVASPGTTTYSYDRADRILSFQGQSATGTSTRPPSSNDAGWTSGGNAYASDNAYSTSSPAKNATTAIKVGTFGFDSTIPSNATITGVTVSVEWKVSTTSSIATLGAQAYVGGAAVGTELVNSTEPTSDLTQSFAVTGLTRAQLLNGVFQVRVRATRGNSNTAFTASLDVVSVRVDYTVPGAIVTLTSDANGNTTAKGADSFSYDQPNRLRSATVAGASETYAYDGDGLRFSRTVGANPAIRSVTDVTTSLPVTLDDGTRTYVYGLDLAYAVSGSTLEVYHSDRLGSVRAITSAAGAVTATYRTDEFGIQTAATGTSGQPYGFTGEPRDGTALSFLRARYYDPTLGRFMSRDAWPGSRAFPQSLNRYVYAGNNPTTNRDPSGRCFLLCAIVGAAVGAVIGAGGYLVGTVAGNVVAGREPTAGLDAGSAIVSAANGALIGAVTGATFGVGTALFGAPIAWNSVESFAVATMAGPLGSAAGIVFKGLTGQEVGPADALGALASIIPLPDGQRVAIPLAIVVDQLVDFLGNAITPETPKSQALR